MKKNYSFLFFVLFVVFFVSCKASVDDSFITYTKGVNGGLEGKAIQSQGSKLIENWMDQETGNIVINQKEILYTSEIAIVPKGTVATVKFNDDSSWNNYILSDSIEDKYKGVFTANCDVSLEPFSMGQYEVTNEFFDYIMNDNYTESFMPVVSISYKQACFFCNELTKKIFGQDTDECVYYSDELLSEVYNGGETLYEAYDKENNKWLKKGYRIPTEAEWEFAARGGNPNEDYWYWPFAGYDPEKKVVDITLKNQPGYNGSGWLMLDASLKDYANYKSNSLSSVESSRYPNKLGLYDMSGNAWEFCYDKHDTYNVYRGGSYQDEAYWCTVYYRNLDKYNSYNNIGFRVCRSIGE